MKEINAAEFDSEVVKGGKVVLDFFSTDVPPVKRLPLNLKTCRIYTGTT